MSTVVPLKYVARAGLLPELTRQTYDSLYKALREAILNSVDAGASEILLDLSEVGSSESLEIRDNGSGMSLEDLQQSFMSLGGSQKFGVATKFGRIGIGSLALMHYAQRVEIETKTIDHAYVTRAVISHPWSLDQSDRATRLDDFRAGEAWTEPAPPHAKDHYTAVRLHGVDPVLLAECCDVGRYFQLIDRLRRVLPLEFPDNALTAQLARDNPDLCERLQRHMATYRCSLRVRSQWSDEESLTKRMYGDGLTHEEAWNGAPRSILKEVQIEDAGVVRNVTIAGYLLSQVRPISDWTGLTARVQNVAVEERTFFDLVADPGFRKYITGEVWMLDGVDRARLINIDRGSFNRESPDYRAIARVIQGELVSFKAERIQAPQRAKASIKRRLDLQVQTIARLRDVASNVSPIAIASPGLPSSRNGSLRVHRSRTLVDDLQNLGAMVAIDTPLTQRSHPFSLRVAADGRRIVAEVRPDLVEPSLELNGRVYKLVFVEARSVDPPLIIKNRPRELVFNLGHPVFNLEIRDSILVTVLALELAYLQNGISDEHFYDRVLRLIAPPKVGGERASR